MSDIDPSVIRDDQKVNKSDLREQFQIAKQEIETLYVRRGGFVSAENYGYVAGAADNSVALAAAITAAGASIVSVPGGPCNIATQIDLAATGGIVGVGWEKTIFRPTSNGIGKLFNITGEAVELRHFEIDASAIVAPTFTGIHIDSNGFVKLDDLYIYGAGIGIMGVAGNACDLSNLRIQNCPVGLQTGGTAAKFPGDWNLRKIDIIPLATTGIGWYADGNTNGFRISDLLTAGGSKGVVLRGSGGGTSSPDGLLFKMGNFTAAVDANVELLKGTNTMFTAGTSIGGSTAGVGLLIDPASASDVEGTVVSGSQIRGNFKEGIRHSGANLVVVSSQVHGNSNGGGAGTYNNIYIKAAALGLVQVVGLMGGLSKAGGPRFANVSGPAKYAVELEALSLTASADFPSILQIRGNVVSNNTTGGVLDNSAAAVKDVGNNI